MNIFRNATIIAAIIMTTTSAFAAGLTAKGTVEKIDKSGDSITLTDGSSFVLTEGLEAETFKAGQKVTITYEKSDGKSMASAVKISQ